MKNRRLFLLFPFLFSIGLKTHAQSATDTAKNKHPYTDTTKVFGGKLPGFFPKGGVPLDRSGPDFYITSAPFKFKNSQQPLIIVDGKKMSYKKLLKMNVNNIETITILKDPASTAKYNRRGRRNGVIFVVTKTTGYLRI